MRAVDVMETITLVTPLAVRFRDNATGAVVADGLIVTLSGIAATMNRQGVFVFNGLPGMRAVEQGEGDAPFWAAQTPRFDFVLDVRDALSRFLPVRNPVKLPRRGLVEVSLFSAASRAPVEGMGTLYADLYDPINKVRAAWAVVEAVAGNRPKVTGVADRDGRVMLPVAIPAPKTQSTNGQPVQRVSAQSFPVDLTFRYGRLAPAETPNLVDVLSQPAVKAWQDDARTTELTRVTLPYGGQVVATTPNPSGGRPPSTLVITPAGA